MALTTPPPPRYIEKFNTVWKDWLYYLWEIVSQHSGGVLPTPPATATSWNAHGNTATGDASNPLLIDAGSFAAIGNVGGYVSAFDVVDTQGLFWYPAKKAFMVGSPPGGTAWSDANIGTNSIAIGTGTVTSGLNSASVGSLLTNSGGTSLILGYNSNNSGTTGILIGSGNSNTKLSSTVVGLNNDNQGNNSTLVGKDNSNISLGGGNYIFGNLCSITSLAGAIAVGLRAVCTGGGSGNANSLAAIGIDVECGGTKSATIGIGVNNTNKLVNNQDNTMYIGVGSVDPTLILQNQRLGVIETTPLSTMDVGGSVGYKYRTWVQSVDGPTINVGAADNELVFIIYPDGGDVTINLPAISGIDRRMYHIKNATTAAGASGHTVIIQPDATLPDKIDQQQVNTAPSNTALIIDRLDSVQLLADGGNSIWWVL